MRRVNGVAKSVQHLSCLVLGRMDDRARAKGEALVQVGIIGLEG